MSKGIAKVSKNTAVCTRRFKAKQAAHLLQKSRLMDASSTHNIDINHIHKQTTQNICNIPFCALFIVFERLNSISNQNSSLNIHNHNFAKQKRYL
jgi:hypothetical protein